jgi:toxin secretion/phage lysis holin
MRLDFLKLSASCGGFLCWLFGCMDGALFTLAVFAVMDYLTGIMCAVLDGKVSGLVGIWGLLKKVMLFLIVGIAHLVDAHIIGHGDILRTAAIIFYLTSEGLSILENAAHLGLPVPEKLKIVLDAMYRDKEKAKLGEEKDK